MSWGRRAWVFAFSGGLLLAILWPILRDPPKDGFPLSNYPMFSSSRDRTRSEIPHVVGYSRQGRHRPLTPEQLGSAEIMQAYVTVRFAIRKGHARDLCLRSAELVASQPEHADLERLEVRTDIYDSLAYFSGDKKPRKTRVHARCPVPSAGAK